MGPEDEAYLGLFIFACLWAAVSTVGFIFVVTSTHEEKSRVAAWLWLASFSASALVAAYYFWRLP
ncbi:MAG: hypothetical protein ACR2HO_07160 [Rubrobacteraceae bacterium]|nr:hypothetical protein [Rubrobacter sp.]